MPNDIEAMLPWCDGEPLHRSEPPHMLRAALEAWPHNCPTSHIGKAGHPIKSDCLGCMAEALLNDLNR